MQPVRPLMGYFYAQKQKERRMTCYPSDAECDAAQIAAEEYIHGHRVSTNRDLGIVRGAMRAALIAAHEHRKKEGK